MNKKQLYESIMKNVAKEVKKALNEAEYNEKKYERLIFDNYSKSLTDEDYATEIAERGEEESHRLFYNYVKDNHYVEIGEFISGCEYFGAEEISDEEVDEYFEEYPELKEKYFAKFTEFDKSEIEDRLEEIEWDELKHELKKYYGNFILFGTKERWTGTTSGADIEEDCTLFDVIMKHSKDCEFYKIFAQANVGIKVQCSHHDGTNVFEIHLLNDDADDLIQQLNDAESEQEEHEIINELKKQQHWRIIDLF